ncbi:hypothetical protein FISHEDRAFT_78167 [Fistulina hepatica ATCC 64428]|nr:hypothetical protein FISHEDRAFT_78167 [Fistulina hepatica ATCC 64428]
MTPGIREDPTRCVEIINLVDEVDTPPSDCTAAVPNIDEESTITRPNSPVYTFSSNYVDPSENILAPDGEIVDNTLRFESGIADDMSTSPWHILAAWAAAEREHTQNQYIFSQHFQYAIGQQDMCIFHAEVALREKDVELQQKIAQLQQKDVQLRQRDALLLQKDAEMRRKDVELAQKDDMSLQCGLVLAYMRKELQTAIAERDAAVAARNSLTLQLDFLKGELRAALKNDDGAKVESIVAGIPQVAASTVQGSDAVPVMHGTALVQPTPSPKVDSIVLRKRGSYILTTQQRTISSADSPHSSRDNIASRAELGNIFSQEHPLGAAQPPGIDKDRLSFMALVNALKERDSSKEQRNVLEREGDASTEGRDRPLRCYDTPHLGTTIFETRPTVGHAHTPDNAASLQCDVFRMNHGSENGGRSIKKIVVSSPDQATSLSDSPFVCLKNDLAAVGNNDDDHGPRFDESMLQRKPHEAELLEEQSNLTDVGGIPKREAGPESPPLEIPLQSSTAPSIPRIDLATSSQRPFPRFAARRGKCTPRYPTVIRERSRHVQECEPQSQTAVSKDESAPDFIFDRVSGDGSPKSKLRALLRFRKQRRTQLTAAPTTALIRSGPEHNVHAGREGDNGGDTESVVYRPSADVEEEHAVSRSSSVMTDDTPEYRGRESSEYGSESSSARQVRLELLTPFRSSKHLSSPIPNERSVKRLRTYSPPSEDFAALDDVARISVDNVDDNTTMDAVTQEYVVDSIIDHKVLPSGTTLYHVTWEGYGLEDSTWEPRQNLEGTEALEAWLKDHPEPN